MKNEEEELVTITLEIHNMVMSQERFQRFAAELQTGKPVSIALHNLMPISAGIEPRHVLKPGNEPPILERPSGRARITLRNTGSLSDDQDLVIKAMGAKGNIPDNQIN